MQPPAVHSPTILTKEVIDVITPCPLGHQPGVTYRALWSDDTSMAGVLSVQGGHRLGAHSHRVNHHHMWVLDGSAEVLGVEVGPGSYVHVPCGTEHDIDATRSDGCTVFFVYENPGR